VGDPEDERSRKQPIEGRSANHFDLAFTEFEFLLDFGQAYDNAEGALVHTRIILTPPSTVTLLHMLEDLVSQYEAAVGPIRRRKS
jgi:hypothetical protein